MNIRVCAYSTGYHKSEQKLQEVYKINVGISIILKLLQFSVYSDKINHFTS